jgi:hypothetical protein
MALEKKQYFHKEEIMKTFFAALIVSLMIGLPAFAQDEEILPAQAEAIRSLAIEKGFTVQSLNDYLIQKWGAPINRLTRKNAALLIGAFQSSTPPTPNAVNLSI